ncbi:unnamed protein product [Blepharisma stoltei]|uniref:TNFR-Cys domain-containing protein n=1 Tax=Blepharisma stoltei TaxID=1481888 RepID=A0AAU9KCG8_9CILI|nr:unnamed protein product [Blepharisma stoltei]
MNFILIIISKAVFIWLLSLHGSYNWGINSSYFCLHSLLCWLDANISFGLSTIVSEDKANSLEFNFSIVQDLAAKKFSNSNYSPQLLLVPIPASSCTQRFLISSTNQLFYFDADSSIIENQKFTLYDYFKWVLSINPLAWEKASNSYISRTKIFSEIFNAPYFLIVFYAFLILFTCKILDLANRDAKLNFQLITIAGLITQVYCITCGSGSFSYQNILCLSYCPTGYLQNTGTNACDLNFLVTLDVVLRNQIILDIIDGISVGNSITNTYPTYDANDPYPAKWSGYYFRSDSYLTSPLMLSPSYSIAIWLKTLAAGIVLVKPIPTYQWVVEILSSGYPKLSLLMSDSSTRISVTGGSNVLNGWFFVSFDGYINTDGTTTISSYIDGSLLQSFTTSTAMYIQDSVSGNIYVGHDSLGFTGFLWKLNIYNSNGWHLSEWRTVGCTSPCTKCSNDLSCPSDCPLNKYIYGSSYLDCMASCDKGCVSSGTCSLCKTKECATCTAFIGTDSCLTCITNAVSDGNGGCTCDTYAFLVSLTQSCEKCDVICSNCLKTAYFECSTCTGSYQLVGNVCLNGCPYGFGGSCLPATTPVIDESFNVDFQGSYGVLTAGASSSSFQFFNTPESVDPIPAYMRGLYFDGSAYLLSSTSVLLYHSFSIGLWLYVTASGDILEKQTQLILSSSGITAIMEDPTQATASKTLTLGTTLADWNYLSVTFEYLSGSTTITIYVNNAIVSTLPISNYIYRDLASTNLMIGKSSSSGFKGFINSFQLWNAPISSFSSYINAVCGSGHACLWSCDLSHYWSGSSYLSCNSCSKGCVRTLNCNICEDSLCSICSGFGSGKCTQCVYNAIGTPCTCIAGFMTSSDGSSCVACSSRCSHCTDTAYNKCSACNIGFYFFSPTGQCLNDCPSGYNKGSNTCDYLVDYGINLDLTDNIRLNTVSGFDVGWDIANTYPMWTDANDPIPSYKRGYYFNGNSYVVSSVMIAPAFAISIWVKPIVAGNILSKHHLNSPILTISIDTSGHPSLLIILSDSSSATLSTSTSTFNSWHFLSFTGQIQSNGKTLLNLYINTALINSYTTSTSIYFEDVNLGELFVGNNQRLGSIGFEGFLSRVMIYNSYSRQADDYKTSSCSSGCSACPSNFQCLSECAFNSYPDSCSSCLSGCDKGCVDNLSCSLCRDKECEACDSFTEECTSCIANAAKVSGHCKCVAGTGWISSSKTCELCDPICDNCSTVQFDGCLTCISGYYLIQSLCMPFCPTGYVINGSNCDRAPGYANFLVFNLMPHQIKDIVTDLASSIPVLTGKDNNFYPNYDTTDPIATIYRGYYFTGSSYMQLPHYTDTSSPLFTFSPKFVMTTWIKPISSTGTIFSKGQISGGTFKKYVSFEFTGKMPSLALTLQDSTTITYTSSNPLLEVTLLQWNFLFIKSSISGTTPQQTISIQTNSNSDFSSSLPSSWFIDLQNSFLITIGARYLNASAFFSFFKGFLWDLKIYNDIPSSALVSSTCNACSLCPIDNANTCLDSCLIDSYWNGSSCITCLTGCSRKGCVRNDLNCNLCQDVICEKCDDYTSTCNNCKTNASLIGTSCQCNSGYYWNDSNENCELCDTSCKSCTSPNWYDCLTCYSGYYMILGFCSSSCPSGYTSSSAGVCIFSQEKIFDLNLNTLNGVVYDKASSIPVVTGSTKKFYPDYEADDPIPAYLRGFYFNGESSILRMPEYSTYVSPKLVIAPTFTISIWLNTETSYSTIISKHDVSDNYSKLYYISLIAGKPAFSLLINSAAFFYMSQASLSNNEWSHIVFTLKMNSSSNIISSYVNGLFDSSTTTGYGTFNDIVPHTTMTIGAQISSSAVYNYYQGFIYTIQIFNALKPISSLSTTSCTESCSVCPISQVCIPNCKIKEYWSGPAYNKCYTCNIKCTKSCRDWRDTCSLCDNLLCESCSDYSSCEACKEHAINPDSCACDDKYVLDDTQSNTCIPIKSGGFKGEDGHYHKCPNLCSSCESLTKCTACSSNASLKNDLCYCHLGYNGTSNCIVAYFSAKITVLADNSLYLTFSESLAKNLTDSDFIIRIENQGEISYKLEKKNSTCYYISLAISKKISKGTLVIIEFLDLSKVISVSNGILKSSEISSSLNSYDPASYSPVTDSVSHQSQAASQTTVSVIASLSIINSSPSSLWSLMNTLQILSYMTLSGIPFSSKMRSFLNNLNSFNLFPNVFPYFIDKNKGNTPYSQAEEFGFDTNLILINQGNDFTLLLGSIAALPLILYFSRCTNRWIGNKFTKRLKDYQYAFYLRFWIQCYLELGAAALIGLTIIEFSNITQIANFALCLAICLLLLATPSVYFLLSYKNKFRIEAREKAFFASFSTFFYEFRTDKGFVSTQYYFLFFARRLVYIINSVCLRDYPQTEVTVNIVLSFLTMMYLALCWPFKNQILQVTNLITEILIFLIMSATTAYLFNFGQEAIEGIEDSIIIIVIAIIAIQTISSIIIFSKTLYQTIKRKFVKPGIVKKINNPQYNQVRKIEL